MKEICFSQADIEKIAKNANIERYKKGSLIFKKNELGNSFFIIKEGRIRITTSHLGKTKIFAELKERDFFGELALLGVKYRTATAVAVTDCEIYRIKSSEFKRLLNDKDFCLKLLCSLAYRLKKADEEIENLTFHSLFGRVLLLLHYKTLEEKTTRLTITQNDIADFTGTTRVPINRICALLKKKGVISINKKGIIEVNKKLLDHMIKNKNIL